MPRLTTADEDARAAASAADGSRAIARAFELVARNGPLSRSALRASLRIGLSTVTGVVQELVERGYVAESGQAASTGGRPPTLLDVDPHLGGVLAVDIGGSNVRYAAADLRGSFTYRAIVATAHALESRRRLRDVVLQGLETAQEGLRGPVRAIAVSIAGIVDPRTRAVTRVDNVPGWSDGDRLEWLEPLCERVLVDNEANLGALGEWRNLGPAGADDLLFVALGAGVGGGLVLGGSLYRGATGAAGEVGLLRVGGDRPVELERVASARALAAEFARRSGRRRATAEDVVGLAAAGDADAQAALDLILDELAVGIANAVLVLDPALVVLGGGFSLAEDGLLEPLRRRIGEYVPSAPRLILGRLGAEAALVGAVEWAADVAIHDLVADLTRPAVAHV